MKCCGSDRICLNSWQSLGIMSSLASPATLKLMAGKSGISISDDAAAKMSMFAPGESNLSVRTSWTSHFWPFLHEQHYLFIVPTFPKEQLQRTLRLWVPHTDLSLEHPAWETLFMHPFAPEKNYFLCAICSIPEGCLGLKGVTGGTMKLFTVAAVKTQLITFNATASSSRGKGHKHISGSLAVVPVQRKWRGGGGGGRKEGSIITVEKVLSWRFCYDPADSPIP